MRRDRRFRFTASRIPALNVMTGARTTNPALALRRTAPGSARARAGHGASHAALAVMLLAQPLFTDRALAQAFAGTPTTAFGTVTFDRSTPGIESIGVNSNQATINWTPTDNQGSANIDFLPNGNTASFTTIQNGNVTVLNRIIAADPVRIVELNGAINASPNVGVWFYAPGGILVGSTAQFNVGSLLLTASDPIADGSGNFLGPNRSFSLAAATQAGAAITIASGAQINADLAASSYVVAVAPRVTQAGSINVDGSAALVAADAVDISMNAGLFDITVTQGTSANGQVVSHTGTTTGAAGPSQRIYLVAVPRNDAITMFVGNGTSLGFDIAGSADIEGNAVVLSAGHNVVATGLGDPFSDTPVNNVNADIVIGTGSYTSILTGRASNSARLDIVGGPFSDATANFASTVSLRGSTEATASLSGDGGYGAFVNVAGDLVLSADARFVTPATALTRTGGSANLFTNDFSQLNVSGGVFVRADGYGDIGGGGNGVGGTALVNVNGGSVSVGANLIVSASGFGSQPTGQGQVAGAGIGGDARIIVGDSLSADGQLSSGNTFVTASGLGGLGDLDNGGAGTGGISELRVINSGTINSFGGFGLNSSGTGGDAFTGTAGTGTGGTARVSGISGTIMANDFINTFASGRGGQAFDSANGGNAVGGSAIIETASGGSISASSSPLVAEASAFGGDGGVSAGAGGGALGGTARILAIGGGTILTSFGQFRADTTAVGGSGASGNSSTNGGNAVGGISSIEATGTGVIRGYGAALSAAGGIGGNGGGSGGSGTGGSALIQTGDGGTIQLPDVITASADGFGGLAGTANGGDGTGGSAVISAFGAGSAVLLINMGDQLGAQSTARGSGGSSFGTGNGGIGRGGTARIVSRLGADIRIGDASTLNDAVVSMDASGGQSDLGTGGAAIAGGFVGLLGDISADGGATLSISGNASGSATADGGVGAIQGAATGGRFVLLTQTGASVSIGGNVDIRVSASTLNENSTISAIGGAATGGTGQIGAGEGTLTIGGDALIDASAIAGDQPGQGGSAAGGFSFISTFSTGGQVLIGGNNISLFQTARGGGSDLLTGTGGAATGGLGQISANNGIIRTTATGGDFALIIDSSSFGGFGANGGDAMGGRIIVEAVNGGNFDTDFVTSLVVQTFGGDAMSADGLGGNAIGVGSSSDAAVFLGTFGTTASTLRIGANVLVTASSSGGIGGFDGAAATGGNAVGGRTLLAANNGSVIIGGDLDVSTSAQGGGGVNGGNASGGINSVAARSATLTVTGAAFLSSAASGGSAIESGGGNGGNAASGSIYWSAQGTASTRAILNVANLDFDASAFGGDGGDGNVSRPTGGQGGTASAAALGDPANGIGVFVTSRGINAEVNTNTLFVSAGAIGGSGGRGLDGIGTLPGADGGAGGAAFGANSNFGTISTLVGAPVITTVANLGEVNFSATTRGGSGGTGGAGDLQGIGGRGGDATGGGVVLLGRGSTVTADDVFLDVSTFGGNGGSNEVRLRDAGGGNAIGGAAGIAATPHFVSGNPVTVTINRIIADASAQGGNSASVGGNAQGGEVFVTLDRQGPDAAPAPVVGTLTIGSVDLTANAIGGNASAVSQGGRGGNATGGTASATSTADAVASYGNVTQSARAFGGDGGGGRSGTSGIDGLAGTDGTTPTNGTNGTDGSDGSAGGDGGQATGGTVRLGITGTAPGGSLSAATINQFADATGGRAGRGGDGGSGGRGGDGGNAISGTNPGGNGGNGGNGGATGIGGNGGAALGGNTFIGDIDAVSGGGTITFTFTTASANATGGEGGDFGFIGFGGNGGNGGSGLTIPGNPGADGIVGTLAASGNGGAATGGIATARSTNSLSGMAFSALSLSANARGGDAGGLFSSNGFGATDAGVGGNALGGAVTFTATGGTIIANSLDGSANGLGGDSLLGTVSTGTGGSVDMIALAGGQITSGYGPFLSADGGQAGSDVSYGSNGVGGRVSIIASGDDGDSTASSIRSLEVGNGLVASATGTGANASLVGGSGTGGSINISITDGASLSINESLFVSVRASGGTGVIGGDAVAGSAAITVGALSALSTVSGLIVDASARGGDAFGGSMDTLLGGNAGPGIADAITINNGGVFSIGSNFDLLAEATGGNLRSFTFGGSLGGSARAGRIVLASTGEGLTFNGDINIVALGTGGGGDPQFNGLGGGNIGIGGAIDFTIDGGTFDLSDATFQFDARGFGGLGGIDFAPVGDAIGGTVNVGFTQSNLVLSNLILDASAIAGVDFGGNGVPATGTAGTAVLQFQSSGVSIGGDISIYADASGTSAFGGTARLAALESTFDISGGVLLSATGKARFDGNLGFTGNGTGGTADLLFRGSTLNIGGIVIVGDATASIILDTSALGLDARAGTITVGAESAGDASTLAADQGIIAFANASTYDSSDAAARGGQININTNNGDDIRANIFAIASASAQNLDAGNGGDAFGGQIALGSPAGQITGNLFATVAATGGANFAGSGGGATAGTIQLVADGGTLAFGDLTLDANATAGNSDSGLGGSAQAGTITLANDGSAVGSLTASNASFGLAAVAGAGASGGSATGGTLDITANGSGFGLAVGLPTDLSGRGADGGAGDNDGSGGAGTGGTINVDLRAGAQFTFGDLINTDGTGGNGFGTGNGGAGTGGSVNLVFDGADTQVTTGFFQLFSRGIGGNAGNDGMGGAGTGGTIGLAVNNGALFVSEVGAQLDARGTAGRSFSSGIDAFDGASGRGGTVNVAVNNALMQLGSLDLIADGFGASGTFGQTSGVAGSGFGGTATVSNFNDTGTSATSLEIFGSLGLSAAGIAGGGFGSTGAGGVASLSANGGNTSIGDFVSIDTTGIGFTATGGTASVTTTGGGNLFITSDLRLFADAAPGGEQPGENAGGGSASITVGAGSTLEVQGETALSTSVFAESGDATGGTTSLSIAGTANFANGLVADASASASSFGGSGTRNAFGGSVIIAVTPTGSLGTGNNVSINVSAQGGAGEVGGNAQAGSVTITTSSGTVDIGGALQIDGTAFGGTGFAGNGGNAVGGTTAIGTAGVFTVASDVLISQSGLGGDAATFQRGEFDVATAGTGRGGNIFITSNGGAISLLGALTATAEGVGGSTLFDSEGGPTTGAGGFGVGGVIRLRGQSDGSIGIIGETVFDASASGGDGDGTGISGIGGDAIGGTASVDIASGATVFTGPVTLQVSGFGGDALGSGGANGGTANAGDAIFAFGIPDAGPASLRATSVVQIADATGGGGGFASTGLAGGSGGNAVGGNLRSAGQTTAGDLIITGAASQSASAVGGTGGAGSTGVAGGSGGNGLGGLIGFGNEGLPASTIGSLVWNTVTGFADGTGGAGGAGGDGTNGGGGGAGIGGFASAGVGGGAMTVNDLALQANGAGGNGGAAGTSGLAGSGGNGIGGNAFAGVGTPATLGVTNTLDIGDLLLTANGIAGTGLVDGTSNAGRVNVTAFRGSTTVTSALLTATGIGPSLIASPFGLVASGLVGRDGSISIVQSATLLVGDVATLGMNNGTITVGEDLFVTADRGMIAGVFGLPLAAPGSITAGGAITLQSSTGGIVNAGALTAGQALLVDAASGNIAIGDAAGSSVGLIARTGTLTAGDVAVQTDAVLLSAGPVAVGALAAPDTGRFLIADASMAALIVTPGDFAPLFAAPTVRVAGDIAINGAVTAGTLIAAATGQISSGPLNIADTLRLTANSLSLSDITLGGDLELTTDADLTVGDVIAGSVTLTSGTTTQTGDINAANAIVITAADTVTTAALRAGTDIDIRSAGDLATTTLSAGDRIFLRASAGLGGPPILTTGAIDAGIIDPASGDARYSVYIDSAGTAETGAINAAGSIGVIAQAGSLTTGALTAGSTVVLLDAGAITTGAITTPDAGGVYIASQQQAPLIGFDIAGNPDYSALFATIPQRLVGGITINGDVNTGVLLAAATDIITINGAVTTASGLRIDGGNLVLGGLTSGGFLQLLTDTDLTLGDVRAEGDVELFAIGDIQAGRISAGDSVFVTARSDGMRGGSITAGDIDAGILRPSDDPGARYGVAIDGAGPVTLGNIAALGAVGAVARGDALSVGTINAGLSVGLLAGTGVSVGAITTSSSGTTIIAADSMVDLIVEDQNGDLDYSALIAAAPVALAGPVSLGGIIDTGTLKIAATGPITADTDIIAAGAVTVIGGAISLANVSGGGLLEIAASGSLALGNIRGEADVDLVGGTDITTGTISAGDSVAIGFGTDTPGGTITTGDIDAGILRPSGDQGAGYQVGIGGVDNVSTGAIAARGNIGVLSTNGSIAVGSVSTTASFLALAAQNVAGTSVSTGTQGVTYVGNASSFDLEIDALGPPSGFDFAPIFALAPVRLGGTVSFGGPVTTGRFTTASTGDFAAQAITAGQSVTVDTGGLAAFAGQVSAPTITATSADIDIGANGGIGTATSDVTLNIAANVGAITIGGSGDTTGYVLSNAEAGRIRGRAINVAAQGSEPAVMTIQTLALTGSGLATEGNSIALTTAGRIRVNGAVALTGAGAGDTLRLNAGQRIEVATDRGGRIGLAGTGQTLAGTLDLTSGAIWVGTEALLGQLSQNENFAGRNAALAGVSTTPDLAGALTAGRLTVAARSSFLVQNSGSAAQRAGFSAGSGGMRISAAGGAPLDVVINGRVLGTGGDFRINDDTVGAITFVSGGEGGIGFTATSTVNACPIGTACAVTPPPPPPPPEPEPEPEPEITPAPVLVILANISELTTRNESTPEEQEEEAREAAEKMPEMRIQRLVDISSVVDDTVIDDPVTGGGNPALWLDKPAASGATGGLK